MSGRIERRFAELAEAGRGGLITFLCAGDPDPKTSAELVAGLPAAGADVIEIGMPFSDPMADGPAIQAGSLRALAAGMTLAGTLDLVRALRRRDEATPVVLMGYFNPIWRYGPERFLDDAREAGVDGLIVVDLPPEEDDELCVPAQDADLAFIRLVTPTTDDERLPKVLANAKGFLYYVSITGITGTRAPIAEQVAAAVARLRRHTRLPVAVGFGIRTPAQAAALAKVADAVVIGSALVSHIADFAGQPGTRPAGPRRQPARPGQRARGRRTQRPEWPDMNWLTDYVRPKIKALVRSNRPEVPENLWVHCPSCERMIFHRDLEANQRVCTHCNHHFRVGPEFRFQTLFDDGAWTRIELPKVPTDPLKFRDRRRYAERLKEAQGRTGKPDAIEAAHGRIDGLPAVIAVMNFEFMAGSMGCALGDGLLAAARLAVLQEAAFIVITASGGARMQEGALSLMQMPRTTIAVEEVKEAGLPYITVLTDPTTGGVTASFAMLGDIAIAEPGAQIGFAGRRVIEQTIRESLPEGFQKAEYLLEHGMIDMVVHRFELRTTLARLLRLLLRPNLDPDAEEPVERVRRPAKPVAAEAPEAVIQVESSGSEGGDELRQ